MSAGSLHLQTTSGSAWTIQTASNGLLCGQTTCGFAISFRVNSLPVSGSGHLLVNQFVSNINVAISATNFAFSFFGGAHNCNYNSSPVPPVLGEVYFALLSYTPTGAIWYLQAQPIVTVVNSMGTTPGTSRPYFVGFDSAVACDANIGPPCFWHGYAPSQADALFIRGGGDPTTISPGNVVTSWTWVGTIGANPAIGDAGLHDQVGSNNFTLQSGTFTLAKYDAPLTYTAPSIVESYIDKSGQAAYFFALSNIMTPALVKILSIASNPTISVQFGGVGAAQIVQTQGPYWVDTTHELPWIAYQLSCGGIQSVVVQNGGTGYSASPTATASAPAAGGVTATFGTPVVAGGVITSIPITNPGSGYIIPVVITITDGTGSAAVAVPVMSGVGPTDVVTYSAADSWLTAVPGPVSAATAAPVFNSAGSLEPAIGGYLPFGLTDNLKTMQLGPQINWPTSQNYFSYNACVNWLKRAPNPWTNAVTSTIDGHPLTITGTVSALIVNPNDSNLVDTRGWPNETGVYTFTCDDVTTNGVGTGTPMQWGLTGSANATISPSGIGAPNISAGTVVNGVLTGQVWQWTVTRANTTTWFQGLRINGNTPGAVGTYAYTAENEFLFSPLSTYAALPGLPSRSKPLAPDQAILNWMTTPHKSTAVVRAVDTLLSYSALAPIVDADDFQAVTNYSWSNTVNSPAWLTGTRTFTIVTVQTYAISTSGWPGIFGTVSWNSPHVYISSWNNPTGYAIDSIRINNTGSGYTAPVVSSNVAGLVLGTPVLSGGGIVSIPVTSSGIYPVPPILTITDSTGSGAIAYPVAAVSPPDPGFAFFSNGSQGSWTVVECVTSTPHNLKTGQSLGVIAGTYSFTMSNGSGATIAGVTLKNFQGYPVFVTAPDKFALYTFQGAVTGVATGIPGLINNAIGQTTVGYTVTMTIPVLGTIPPEAHAQIAAALPGAGVHVNIPIALTDAASAAMAVKYRDNFPRGRKVFVEFGLEQWNFPNNWIYVQGTGSLGLWGTVAKTGRMAGSAIRTGQHHQIWIAIFNQPDINGNTNRGNEIVCCYGSQYTNSSITDSMVTALNTYNSGSPPAQFRMDRLMIAPYQSIPASTSFVQAFASLGSFNSTSKDYLSAAPWSRQAALGLWRHWCKYSQRYNGPTGGFAPQFTSLAAYNLVGGQAAPVLHGYEGGVQQLVPPGIDTGTLGGFYLGNQVSHDLFYDPDSALCVDAVLQMCQQGGMVLLEYLSMCLRTVSNGADVPFVWGLAGWSGQPAGLGDGSGTTTVGTVGPVDGVNPAGTPITNKFWGDDGKAHHLDNASPMMQAARDWMDAANSGGGGITPRAGRWFPGLARMRARG